MSFQGFAAEAATIPGVAEVIAIPSYVSVRCENGKTVSIAFSPFNYCGNRWLDDIPVDDLILTTTVEVAVFLGDGTMMPWPTGTDGETDGVLGYQDRESVTSLVWLVARGN